MGLCQLAPFPCSPYPSLSHWAGVSAFKQDLKAVLGLPRQRPALVANRSARLVRLAARLLCLRCENILATDMEWPAYMAALAAECQRTHRSVTTIPVRQSLFRDGVGKAELVDRLAACYQDRGCDGLFLSAVTYQGVRMPIRELVEALGKTARPRWWLWTVLKPSITCRWGWTVTIVTCCWPGVTNGCGRIILSAWRFPAGQRRKDSSPRYARKCSMLANWTIRS